MPSAQPVESHGFPAHSGGGGGGKYQPPSRQSTQSSASALISQLHLHYTTPGGGGGGKLGAKKEPVHLPYTSASPDFSDVNNQHGSKQQGLRPDPSYTPRHHSRQRLRGFSMAAHYGNNDFFLFSAIQSRKSADRESRYSKTPHLLPQLSVTPAPTQSKRHFHQQHHNQHRRSPATAPIDQPIRSGRGEPRPISVKRVEVTLHEVQQHPTTTTTAPPTETPAPDKIRTRYPSPRVTPAKPKDVPLRSVDLNKDLDVGVARRSVTSKTPAGANDTSYISRRDTFDAPAYAHLPLKEAYLKPDSSPYAEQAYRYQYDKTVRILKWLKSLSYLDERAIARGRLEVEKTQFELPEIHDLAALV